MENIPSSLFLPFSSTYISLSTYHTSRHAKEFLKQRRHHYPQMTSGFGEESKCTTIVMQRGRFKKSQKRVKKPEILVEMTLKLQMLRHPSVHHGISAPQSSWVFLIRLIPVYVAFVNESPFGSWLFWQRGELLIFQIDF